MQDRWLGLICLPKNNELIQGNSTYNGRLNHREKYDGSRVEHMTMQLCTGTTPGGPAGRKTCGLRTKLYDTHM